MPFFRINHYHHSPGVETKLNELLEVFRLFQQEVLMAIQEFRDAAAAANESLDGIAGDIQRLEEQLNAGGMTPTEEAEALSLLTALKDRLAVKDAERTPPTP